MKNKNHDILNPPLDPPLTYLTVTSGIHWRNPANTTYWPNVVVMLGHRLWLWASNTATLGERLVLVKKFPEKHEQLTQVSDWRWSTICHASPTLSQHWGNVLTGELTWEVHSPIPGISTLQWANASLTLGQRRRRWPSIKPALVQCSVLTVSHSPDKMSMDWHLGRTLLRPWHWSVTLAPPDEWSCLSMSVIPTEVTSYWACAQGSSCVC